MNPTFSSPVLTERCTYRWEDLEKAAQGIYTDELKAEQERLRMDFEAQKAASGFDAVAAEGFFNAAPVAAAAPTFAAEPMPEAAPVQKASTGFTVPFRDESGFRVKMTEERPAARRPFFEPPRVTFPPRQTAMDSQSVQPLVESVAPVPAVAAPSSAAVDPALLESVAQETARAVTANLLAQIDIIVAMALKTASAKVKSDVEAAVSVAAQQAVREALSKVPFAA